VKRALGLLVRSSPTLQLSASARRPARRWPRHGTPLRWASASRRTPPGKPPGGSGAPPSGPRPIPAEDAAWLETLRPWATQLARRTGIHAVDAEDVVQQTFTEAAARWHSFGDVPDMPEHTARRRWIYVVLVRNARGLRRTRARAMERAAGEAADELAVDSAESATSAREILAHLQQSTTPERWRAWLMHEVDAVPVAEIARQEGRPVATVHNRLRLAREDFTAAFAREAAALKGPGKAQPFTKRRR
jgi:DNA-directed RNA polymerase specialized sigma24 family protein